MTDSAIVRHEPEAFALRRDGSLRTRLQGVNLTSAARLLAEGEIVSGNPVGNSMRPLVPSGARVVIAPVIVEQLEVDDIVLARVAGRAYLHKILATDPTRRRVQIGNNRGGVNGWTSLDRVFGICVEVDGVARPRAAAKARERT